MKHAEDLRRVRAQSHRESTTLRGALAAEAAVFASCAKKSAALRASLAALMEALHDQLWQQDGGGDGEDLLSSSVPSQGESPATYASFMRPPPPSPALSAMSSLVLNGPVPPTQPYPGVMPPGRVMGRSSPPRMHAQRNTPPPGLPPPPTPPLPATLHDLDSRQRSQSSGLPVRAPPGQPPPDMVVIGPPTADPPPKVPHFL